MPESKRGSGFGDRCGAYCPDLDGITFQCVSRDGQRGQHRDRDGLEFDDQDAEYQAVIP